MVTEPSCDNARGSLDANRLGCFGVGVLMPQEELVLVDSLAGTEIHCRSVYLPLVAVSPLTVAFHRPCWLPLAGITVQLSGAFPTVTFEPVYIAVRVETYRHCHGLISFNMGTLCRPSGSR